MILMRHNGLRSQVSGLRDNILDSLRGVAVYLVVFGHLILWLGRSGINIPKDKFIFDIIYSFHIPFFFMVAGYAHGMKARSLSGNNYLYYFKKFVLDLYIPGVVFSLIYWSFKYFILTQVNNSANFESVSINDLYQIPFFGTNQYYFLCTLFLIKITHTALEYLFNENKIFIHSAFWILLFISGHFFNVPLLHMRIFFIQGLYFHIGYIMKTREILECPKILYALILICVGVLCCVIPFTNFLTKTGAALCMSLGLFTLFYSLKINNSFLALCGANSMIIYCLHNYVIAMFRLIYTFACLSRLNAPVLMFLLCFVLAVLIPLLVVKIYKRVKFLRWIEYIFYPGELFYKK